MAINLGDAILYFKGDMSGLNNSIGDAQSKVQSSMGNILNTTHAVGMGLTAVGAGVIGTLGAMTVGWANAGDAVQEASQRTGMGTEALSELKYAAELSGTSLEGVETAAKFMNKGMGETAIAMQDAEAKATPFQLALDQLGLKFSDVKNLKPEDQFMMIAGRLADVSDHGTKTALAMDLFGRSGTAILPMLADGSAGLQQMRDRARELGLVFDEAGADKAAKFADALADLKGAFQGLVIAIGPVIAESIIPFIQKMIEGAIAIQNFAKEHEALFGIMVRGTAIFFSLSLGLGTLLLAVRPLIMAFTALQGILGAFSIGITGVGAAAAGAEISLAGLVGIIAGPVGLIAALTLVVPLVFRAIESIYEYSEAVDDLNRRQQQWSDEVLMQLDILREHGIQLDEDKLRLMDVGQQQQVLSEIIAEVNRRHRAELSLTDETATQTYQMIMNHAFNAAGANEEAADRSTSAWSRFLNWWIEHSSALNWLFGGTEPPPLPEGRAVGGSVFPGTPYIVGEQGPELFIPSVSGTIIPAQDTAKMAGGITINGPLVNVQSVNASSPSDVRAFLNTVGIELSRRMSLAGVS